MPLPTPDDAESALELESPQFRRQFSTSIAAATRVEVRGAGRPLRHPPSPLRRHSLGSKPMHSLAAALKQARTVVDSMTESHAVISDERAGVQPEESDR